MQTKHNPIARALRSGNLPRATVVRARKGKGAYRRAQKHKGTYA